MAWVLKMDDATIESGLVHDFDASLSGIGQELGAGAYSMRLERPFGIQNRYHCVWTWDGSYKLFPLCLLNPGIHPIWRNYILCVLYRIPSVWYVCVGLCFGMEGAITAGCHGGQRA